MSTNCGLLCWEDKRPTAVMVRLVGAAPVARLLGRDVSGDVVATAALC